MLSNAEAIDRRASNNRMVIQLLVAGDLFKLSNQPRQHKLRKEKRIALIATEKQEEE